MRTLLSKLLAGGLSAGVVLVWWPHLFETDSATSWIIRGVAFTAVFELLLVCLAPLEEEFWKGRIGSPIARRADAARDRFNEAHPKMRISTVGVVALLAVCLSATLAVKGADDIVMAKKEPREVTQLTKVVKVVQPTKTKKIYIREPAAVAGAQASSTDSQPEATEPKPARAPVRTAAPAKPKVKVPKQTKKVAKPKQTEAAEPRVDAGERQVEQPAQQESPAAVEAPSVDPATAG